MIWHGGMDDVIYVPRLHGAVELLLTGDLNALKEWPGSSLGASGRVSGCRCFIFESFVSRPGCLWPGLCLLPAWAPLVRSPAASASSSSHLSPSLGASGRASGCRCFILESFVSRPGCLWSGLRLPLLYLRIVCLLQLLSLYVFPIALFVCCQLSSILPFRRCPLSLCLPSSHAWLPRLAIARHFVSRLVVSNHSVLSLNYFPSPPIAFLSPARLSSLCLPPVPFYGILSPSHHLGCRILSPVILSPIILFLTSLCPLISSPTIFYLTFGFPMMSFPELCIPPPYLPSPCLRVRFFAM